MQEIKDYECKVHVCVCVNEKPVPKSCCAKVGGMEFFQKLKAEIREANLSNDIWVTRTGCLGFCNDVGTTVVIHTKGKPSRWYTEVTAEDYRRVWDEITATNALP